MDFGISIWQRVLSNSSPSEENTVGGGGVGFPAVIVLSVFVLVAWSGRSSQTLLSIYWAPSVIYLPGPVIHTDLNWNRIGTWAYILIESYFLQKESYRYKLMPTGEKKYCEVIIVIMEGPLLPDPRYSQRRNEMMQS